jgi:hypothetical protein
MNKNKEYFPPKWMSILMLVILIIGPILIYLAGAEINLITAFLAAFTLMCLLALVDLKVSIVIIRESEIEIKGLFKKIKIPIKNIDHVTLEDWESHIKLKDGAWQKLPSWFSNHKSFYGTLRHRLQKPA